MNRKRAFTLVELLVVVVIIGILSSLVTVGVMSAVQAAKRSKIAMEMHQITLALETYKNKFGEYPPDLWDRTAVVRHVKKRWPRFQLPTPPSGVDNNAWQYFAFLKAVDNVYQNSGKQTFLLSQGITLKSGVQFMDDFQTNPTAAAPNGSLQRQASYLGALSFWLGGFPNQDGKFAGFSADPEAPLGKEYTSPTVIRNNNGDPNYTWTPNNIELGTQDKDSAFYEMIIGKNIFYVTTANDIVFPVLVNRDATVNKDGSTPVPYVYFRGNSSGGKMAYAHLSASNVYLSKGYEFSAATIFAGTPYAELGVITAYAKSVSATGSPLTFQTLIWHEAERFQLIHPGLDGVFGVGRSRTDTIQLASSGSDVLNMSGFRSTNTDFDMNDIGQKDFDNLTNFSDYQQIKSILP
ncbi:MAG: type II secretion system GspH family protein [Planctomycetaceae bacterium]|nr:type II secretion system GspH family protein [Planctomycetaceae bacterium]